MHILIAPNSFKNSLPADAAAAAIGRGLQLSNLICTNKCFPVGDGGDGTGDLLIKHFNAKRIIKKVHDPLGKKIMSSIGIAPASGIAIIELADASGLRLIKKSKYDPLHATTYGTGELISCALDNKVKQILLCIGGSATVDGGIGIIRALGGKFVDARGKELKDGPSSLLDLADIDLDYLDKRILDTELIILCDVENKLLGDKGSAAVFGPQKGASKKDIKKLDACLDQLSKIIDNKTGTDVSKIKYGGAAGGVAAGLFGLLHAKLVNGVDHFLDITGFDQELKIADLVITGEGSIDKQTLHGKAPFGVARRARQNSIPVIAMAGRVPLQPDPQLEEYFDVLLPINHDAIDLDQAMKSTYDNLVRSGRLIGTILSERGINDW